MSCAVSAAVSASLLARLLSAAVQGPWSQLLSTTLPTPPQEVRDVMEKLLTRVVELGVAGVALERTVAEKEAQGLTSSFAFLYAPPHHDYYSLRRAELAHKALLAAPTEARAEATAALLRTLHFHAPELQGLVQQLLAHLEPPAPLAALSSAEQAQWHALASALTPSQVHVHAMRDWLLRTLLERAAPHRAALLTAQLQALQEVSVQPGTGKALAALYVLNEALHQPSVRELLSIASVHAALTALVQRCITHDGSVAAPLHALITLWESVRALALCALLHSHSAQRRLVDAPLVQQLRHAATAAPPSAAAPSHTPPPQQPQLQPPPYPGAPFAPGGLPFASHGPPAPMLGALPPMTPLPKPEPTRGVPPGLLGTPTPLPFPALC